MNLPPGEITLTPDSCSECIVLNEWTQEEEDPNEASSEVQCPVSVKSCYLFGSFHSPSNEQLNVTPVSGAEGRNCLEDSMTKYPLDSITNISSDELFGSYHSPSNVQPNETTVIGTEGQTKEFDDQNKLVLQVAEDHPISILDESCQYANVPQDDPISILDESCQHANVPQDDPISILDESCQYANVSQDKPFSEDLKSQVFGGRKTDHTDSNPDNTFEVANFPDTIPLSGSFISQSSKPVAQSTYCTPLKSVSAPPITVKMEYTREKMIPTRHLGPDADHNSIPMKTTPTRKGPILLKSSSGSSRVDLSLKEKTFNQSRVNQNQSIPKAVSGTEKVGSDEDEEGQTDVCQCQKYPSPDNVDLEPSTGVPSQNTTVPISNMKMSQPHAEVSLQRMSMPQPNMDTHLPNIGMPQPITGVSMQHVLTTSSQPTSPSPQLSLVDSMTLLRPPVGSQPCQGVFSPLEGPRYIDGHRSEALETGPAKEDGDYVVMTGKPQNYSSAESFEQAKTTDGHERMTVEQGSKTRKMDDTDRKKDRSSFVVYPILTEDQFQSKKDSMKNNVHPDKRNIEESLRISRNSRLCVEGEFNNQKEASSDALVDQIESGMKTSSHQTVESLPSEDAVESFLSVDSDGYARIKELDDVDYETPVSRETRHDSKPLKVRPKSSAQFPLPPVPGVQKRQFSEADVDNQWKIEQPLFQTVAEEITSKPQTNQEDAETSRMIRVRGLTRLLSLDALEIFFENKKRCGGGEIETLEWRKSKGEAFITFKDPTVVQSVLEKQKTESFYLEEMKLTVEEYVPCPSDPLRLFLKNLSPRVTHQCLSLYLELNCKATPIEIHFGRLQGTASVTFSEPPDVELLLRRVKEKSLEGQYIQVIKVPITHRVWLMGLPPSTTRDIVELYFKNAEQSGGGPLTDIKFGRDKQSCVVSFENVKDAERVCMRPHTIDKKDIEVCLYYECLDSDLDADEFSDLTHGTHDAEGEFKLPDPVELKDLSCQILRFLVKNEKHRQMFQKNLSDINAVARWPSSVNKYLIIDCTVNAKDKNARLVLRNWSIRVVDKVNSFIAGIEVAEFNLIEKAWFRVINGLQASTFDNLEDVGVFVEHEKYNITVAGPRAAVEKLQKKISDMIDRAEIQIELENQSVTETKQIKTYEMTLLRASRFKQDIEKMYQGLHFDLNLKDKRAIFVGQSDIVQKAIVQMHEKLQSFVSISIPMSKAARDLLFVKEIRDYIKQKMKSNKMIGVWDVDCKGGVRMFARDEREVQKAIQLVKDCLVEKEISLDDVMVRNVQEQQWSQLVQRIQEKHTSKVAIETSLNSISIVAVDDIFQGVFDEIKVYLEEYYVQGLFLALDPVRLKFIKRYKIEDIKALEKKFESSHVNLLIIDYGDQKGIKINGTKDGCKAVKTELKKMAKNVITKEHAMVNKVGLTELLQSPKGRDHLSSVELRFKCLMVIKDSSTSSSLQLEGASGGNSSGCEVGVGQNYDDGQNYEPTDRLSSSDSGDASIDAERTKVSVVQGELAKQKDFASMHGGTTLPSSSTHRSVSSSSNISIVNGICRCTLPHLIILEIVQGDITKETTDVIVNSVLFDLNLNQGLVSKAILAAGGISIQQEYQDKNPDLKKDGYVVTNAGNLPCKMIIHMAAQDKRKEWEDMIKRVLDQAEQLKCQSISFPALGTGGRGLTPKKIAQIMYSACREFAKSQLVCLKKIRVVLFKETMLTAFVQAIRDHISDQGEPRKSKIPVAWKLFKGRSKSSSLVFSITIDSELNFNAAVQDIEGFIKNEFMRTM